MCVYILLLNFININIEYDCLNINTHYTNNLIWKLLFYLNDTNLNILILLFILLINNFNKHVSVSFYCFFCFVMLSNIHNFFCIDVQNFLKNIILNKELYNGILIIHPVLTYVTVVLYLITFNDHALCKNTKNNTLKEKSLFCALSGTCALVLGSVWAQQELNWGGWWNWDSVEIILMSLNLFLLVLIHNTCKKKITFYINVNFNYKYMYVFVFYFIVRSNFINSIHAFSVSNQLQKYTYVTLLLLFLFFFYNYILLKFEHNSLIFFKKPTKIDSLSNTWLLFYLSNALIITIMYVSVCFYTLNVKIKINLFHYVGIFIKMWVFFYFYNFFKKRYKIPFFYILLGIFSELPQILVGCFLLIFKNFLKKKNYLNDHFFIIFILFFLNGCSYDVNVDSFMKSVGFFEENVRSQFLFYNNVLYLNSISSKLFLSELYNNIFLLTSSAQIQEEIFDFFENYLFVNMSSTNLFINGVKTHLCYCIDNGVYFYKNYSIVFIWFIFISFFIKITKALKNSYKHTNAKMV